MKKIAKKITLPANKTADSTDYVFRMKHAAQAEEETGVGQLLPAIVFSAFVILIVRMYAYTRPMGQFFWTSQSDTTPIADFFAYYKMLAIVLCTAVALLLLLYRITTQSLAIKRSYAYIPMAVYAFFVLLSYIFSDYKEFAWLGWNDRFEGTLPLLCYMIMLFYMINTIKTEKDIKIMLWPLAASSAILSLIGISQATDHDFFRTTLGQKLLLPNQMTDSGFTLWESVDLAAEQGRQFLNFTFQNKEIYQTVYNINYVSFYLTLLIPLFGMLFILAYTKGKDEKLTKKIGLAVLFALIIYNLIGSASSGGLLGLGIIGIMGLIVLNKKLLLWVRPLLILFVITGITAGITADRWIPELTGAVNGVLGTQEQSEPLDPWDVAGADPGTVKPWIDFIETNEQSIDLSINGNTLTIEVDAEAAGTAGALTALDADQQEIPLVELTEKPGTYALGDDRFYPYMTLSSEKAGEQFYITMNTAKEQWTFVQNSNRIYYYNKMGRLVALSDIEHFGFSDNPAFGSWRGYIWSRSFPLLKNSMFIGTGADTYCAVFPQEDYAGRYSVDFSTNIIVDKPHNMYLGAAIGTGVASLAALLALYALYLFQSIKLYTKMEFGKKYPAFAGAGIFFGISGFLVAALVNDSSVSVMPMFYGLLGMGIVINQTLSSEQ